LDISSSSFNPSSLQRPPSPQRAEPAQAPTQESTGPTTQSTAVKPEADVRISEQPQKPEQPPLRDSLSPEEKNNISDDIYDRSNEIKAERQSDQDNVRETVVEISVAQQQKANLELYIEQSTGEEIDDSPSVSPQELIEFAQKQQRNDTLQAVADSDIPQEAIQERRQTELRQSLEDKFSQALGDNSNPPSIDLNV